MNEVVRNTRQRSAVSAVLAEAEGFHSAQELHAMLRTRGERVGLTVAGAMWQRMAAPRRPVAAEPPDVVFHG